MVENKPLDPKIIAMRSALRKRDPFCTGTCALLDHQRFLYYTHGDSVHRIDVCNAGADELDALYRACKPAEFGRNGENIIDESYRKAGKMDLTSFATMFDPYNLGVHEQVSKALLTESFPTMSMELYKLNVYGKGDFFKAHKDTPRSTEMFGSLVVVLPTPHEGGQFVLRQHGKDWSIDFADKFAAATQPSVCFVAFFSDIEHEVLPVTSGHRLTLTYNLYRKPMRPNVSPIATPFFTNLRNALVDLVNDKSNLPNGGYLGFGLIHEYIHTGYKVVDALTSQLKGSDRTLADVCEALGLRYCLRLLYRGIGWPELNFITINELEVDSDQVAPEECGTLFYLHEALQRFSIDEEEGVIDEVEGVNLVGEMQTDFSMLRDGYMDYERSFRAFYRDPPTEVMEITPMKSSVDFTSTFMTYGNEAELEHFYGTACMLIAVEPAESRAFVGL